MKIQFLGTAAAHSFPLTFCKCKTCEECRKLGGKNLRKRSSIIINDELLVDMCPDFVSACFQYGVNVSNLKYLLQTHSHQDHFDAGHILTRRIDWAVENMLPITIISSEKSLEDMREQIKWQDSEIDILTKKGQDLIQASVHPIKELETIKISDYEITAFNARHDEKRIESLVYLIKQNDKTIFYGTDMSVFGDEIYEYLNKNKIIIDLLILDQTYGHGIKADEHLNADMICEIIFKLKENKNITQNSKIFATHLSHEGNFTYDKQNSIALKNGYEIAFDGLMINI